MRRITSRPDLETQVMHVRAGDMIRDKKKATQDLKIKQATQDETEGRQKTDKVAFRKNTSSFSLKENT